MPPPPPSAAAAYVYLWNMHTMSFCASGACARAHTQTVGGRGFIPKCICSQREGWLLALHFFCVLFYSCVRVCTREHARMSRDEITSCVCACACVIAIASNARRLPPHNILAAQYWHRCHATNTHKKGAVLETLAYVVNSIIGVVRNLNARNIENSAALIDWFMISTEDAEHNWRNMQTDWTVNAEVWWHKKHTCVNSFQNGVENGVVNGVENSQTTWHRVTRCEHCFAPIRTLAQVHTTTTKNVLTFVFDYVNFPDNRACFTWWSTCKVRRALEQTCPGQRRAIGSVLESVATMRHLGTIPGDAH